MAFYNNWGDLWGDVKNIATNPIVDTVGGTLLAGPLGGMIGGTLGKVVSGAGDVLSKIPGVSSIENWLSNQSPQQLAMMGLSAAQIVNAGKLQNQASQYAKDALTNVQQNYAQRQPLRQFGEQQMLDPQIANLSGLLKNSGPYAAGLPTPTVQPIQRYTGSMPAIT